MMDYCFKAEKGLNREIVEAISAHKQEPVWMLEFRLKALEQFESMPLPSWGPDLSELNIHDIHYYIKPLEIKKNHGMMFPILLKILL